MIDTKIEVHIVIKGYYEKPEFENRFTIEWPFQSLPTIGHMIDIKQFLASPDERMKDTYRVDMVQWTIDGPYIMLLPTR